MLSIGSRTPSTAFSVVKDAPRTRKPSKIRIGMVLDQPFPPDARVEREASALAEAGYEVHLLCLLRPEDVLPDEAYRGFYIHRVDPNAVSIQIPFLGIQSRFLYRGLFKNYFRHFKNIDTAWHTLIHRFVRHYGIHILHIHDLRLVDTGLSISTHYGLPLVADLHENYPALMQMMKGRDNIERGKVQRARWEKIEKNSLSQSFQVITVTEEARERLLKKGVPSQKIQVLENTVDMVKFMSVSINQDVFRQFKPYFVLTYVGHLNDRHRGIQTVIEAMGLLKNEIPELRLIAAGATREPYLRYLQDIIDTQGLKDRVHFTGWLDESEFATYIEASDICLCPHLANDHTNATFPNKVYLYHLFKKPIIVSDAVPLQRYVDNTQGGMAFESGNPVMLANLIRLLHHRADIRREMALNGHKAVLERYNWQRTAETLVTMYQQFQQSQ